MALAPVLLAADSVGGQTSFLRDIAPGRYEAFYLKMSGVAGATLQLTEAEFGRVRLLEAGRELAAVDYDVLAELNRLKGGNLRVTNGAGGTHEFPCVIPRNYYDNNVHQIIEADVVQIAIQYGSAFPTDIPTTGVQKVYGLTRETGEMSYNLLLTQIDQVYGTGTFTLPLRHENVLAIYPFMPTTENDLRRVRVVKDGVEAVNIQTGSGTAGRDQDLWEISDILNPGTSAQPSSNNAEESNVCEIQIAEPGEIGEFLSDDVVVEFTTAPSTTYTQRAVILSADFTPTKLRQTKVETAAIVQRKISRKNTLGRGRPVQTLRIAAE